jgi:hypothetical protein
VQAAILSGITNNCEPPRLRVARHLGKLLAISQRTKAMLAGRSGAEVSQLQDDPAHEKLCYQP